jgi:hypothetical protein
MFVKLFAEVEAIRYAFPGFGVLEALTYIGVHANEYDPEIREELSTFMGVGAEFFAEV